MQRYTKAQLEELVCSQLENLTAMQDLLRIMKLQNELISMANKKLSKEMADYLSEDYIQRVRKN